MKNNTNKKWYEDIHIPEPIKQLTNTILSALAMIILAGLAFNGVLSLISASPSVATGFGVITVALLTKTALKK